MKNIIYKIALLGLLTVICSCEKLVESNVPETFISQQNVFSNSDLATAAITGIYTQMTNIAGAQNISAVSGLSSDEFICHTDLLREFFENQINPINSTNNAIFTNYFSSIYRANVALEGLNNAVNIPSTLKAQLTGEAYFIRAFTYFNLVNLYGAVPLQLISDYRLTRVEPRAKIETIYEQILKDLKNAEELLSEQYVSSGRVRPNKAAAQFLLSKAYLYLKDWTNAEKYSTLVIDRSTVYILDELDKVFLTTSKEAIWQLYPPANSNTREGDFFIITSTPSGVSLREKFVNTGFEQNDKRKSSWIKSYTNATGTYYFPFKYKVRASSAVSECSTIFRLGELYLIRAEARANLNKIDEAIDDVDKIRNRAGITLIKTLNPDKTVLLEIIQNERVVELFSETGNRWFDLKRTGQATLKLKDLKSNWQETDIYYPIPYNETSRNPNVSQNEGY